MNSVKVYGKFLDQPRLVYNFSKIVPPALAAVGSGVVAYDVYKSPSKNKDKIFIQNGLTMTGAVASSLYAPNITAKIFRTAPKLVKPTGKILMPKEIRELAKSDRKLLDTIIPEPENITSKDIFSEIGRLSVFGLIPVVGGIAGGIAGDRITDSKYKKKIPNKIKEGVYQYLANIFMCNIGAGAALLILEKLGIKSKGARALGMVSGIILTGVIGGSAIANLIGRKVVNKCFKSQQADEKERKPEPLDICLHSDDIATVAVMSGLKWIEPLLPALYSISGYRAGKGYRN